MTGVLAVLTGVAHAGQTTPVLVDRELSVGAGATLANAAGEAVELIEERYLPRRLFEERGAARRSANITYRTLRLLFFDRPQEQWLLVANHEVFGHGGRVRELFDGFLAYHIDPPAPYGAGGGVTFYELDRDYGIHDLQAISVAGMEVNAVAAQQIARRAFRENRITARTALRYLGFELDAFEYILKTGDEPERPGHDVSDFLQVYNEAAGVVDAEPLTPATLRREALVSLANPMLASALVSIARYLATGRPDAPVFAVSLRSVRLMPALRYRLAPFGPEWVLTTDMGWRGATGQVGVRVGRAPLQRPWGVNAQYSGLQLRGWDVSVGLEGWRQPPLAIGAWPDFGAALIGEPLEWGGQVRVRAESALTNVWWSRTAATLIVDAGLKSRGFVAGEPLDEGLVLRAGIGLPLGPR